MGQHSTQPSRQNPLGRMMAPGKRRWTTVAAGAAVIVAASTTAWAAVANGDDPKPATALAVPPTPATTVSASATASTTATSTSTATSSTATPAAKTPEPTPSKTAAAAAAKSEKSSPAPIKAPSGAQPKTTQKRTAAQPRTKVISSGTCGASYYGEPQMTASGERFNPSAMTAAHKTLPLGSKVRVTNPANGDSVTVRINDRGPYVGGRCLDLSKAAFEAIGNTSSGVMRVKYEVLAT